jgi:hypothetical protein
MNEEKKEKIIDISKLSTKNLTAVPKEVCEILDLHLGDKILYVKKDNEVVIRKV